MIPVKPGFTESDNATVYALYQALIHNGVRPEDLDKGYAKANYLGRVCPSTYARSCQLGANDGVLAPQEIMDYALEAAESSETMRRLVEGTLHRPIPWALDDLDPKTVEDAALREQLHRAVHILRDILARQGLQKGTPEYQERLAVGLYYFALVPDRAEIEKLGSEYFILTFELEGIGLFEWTQYLHDNGGWGWLDDKGVALDDIPELDALEAIKKRQGKCTERAKILYAILQHAEIPASFAYVNPVGSKNNTLRKLWDSDPTKHHVCVAIPTSAGTRFLDPSNFSSNPIHREYYPSSPREFWANELNNRGGKLMNAGFFAPALDIYNIANAMDPVSPVVLYNRANLFASTGKLKEAMADFTTAFDSYPVIEFSCNYALMLANAGDTEGAYTLLDKIGRRFPNWGVPFQHKANMLFAKGDYAAAEDEYTKLIQRMPKNTEAYVGRANTYIKMNKGSQARADLDVLIERGYSVAEVYGERAATWLMEQQWQNAIADCNKGVALQGDFSNSYRVRALAHAGLQSIPAALQDMLRYYKLTPRDHVQDVDTTANQVETIFYHVWNEPGRKTQKETFERSTGISVAKFQTLLFMVGLIWEMGRQADAVQILVNATQVPDPTNCQSDTMRSITQQLFADLPATMRQDKQVADILSKF